MENRYHYQNIQNVMSVLMNAHHGMQDLPRTEGLKVIFSVLQVFCFGHMKWHECEKRLLDGTYSFGQISAVLQLGIVAGWIQKQRSQSAQSPFSLQERFSKSQSLSKSCSDETGPSFCRSHPLLANQELSAS